MKRIIVITAAALVMAAPAADAQGFLSKLKQKAENAVEKKVSEKMGIDTSVEETQTSSSYEMKASKGKVAQSQSSQNSQVQVVKPEEQLERRRTSSFGWDGKVTPSTAKFPIPLLNEFPAIPSAAELANPTESGMVAYYQAIKKVTLRAEELNSDTTCEDAFALKWREEQANKLAAAYGLTRAEFDAYNNGTLSASEREAVEKKMLNAMFGGVDIEKAAADAEADMKKMQNMSEDERIAMVEKQSINAMMKVYNADPAETKYVTGMEPSELRKALESEMAYQNAQMKKGNRSEKPGPDAQKMEAYGKMMEKQYGSAYTKRAQALQQKVQQASMEAARANMGGMGALMDAMNNMEKFEKKTGMVDVQAAEKKYMDDCAPMMAALQSTASVDAKFSAAEKKKVEAIKAKIYSTDDPKEYNALYAQAIEAIKTYRVRAAEVWRAAVQQSFEKVKAEMPNFIKAQRSAVEAGILPECALWRAPLNAVVQAGDILEEAYSEFPCDYPQMYSEEVVRQIPLKEGETSWWPEFYVSSDFESVLAGKNMFKQSDGKVYQFNKGSWTPVPDNYEGTMTEAPKPVSASWKSSDGKREVIYNADGGFLQLPEGDIVYPTAWQKQGDAIVWAIVDSYDQPDGGTLYQITKCVYKL